jgi:MoaA/NifB/PqqE/SkfB family radical SAM enzyme
VEGDLVLQKPVTPRAIRLEASSFCQLRCPSCPTATGAIKEAIGSGFLQLDDFRNLLDQNPALKEIELSNYGEIFLNPQILDILELAHARKVILAATNGVNLNNVRDEVLEGIVKFKLRRMTCSIDGASRETYKVYRVGGNFDAAIENIKKINRLKQTYCSKLPLLHWQFIVFGHNEHELPKARLLAKDLGMTFAAKLSWDENFSPVRSTELIRRETRIGAANRTEYEERHQRDYMHAICHQLWDMPQINWDGKVLGCCANCWGDFGGNAFRDGLVPSLNNEKMTYARMMLRGQTPSRPDIPCASCHIYLGMRARGLPLKRR